MKNIKKISEKLKNLNKKLYIVGGFCRSKILEIDNIGGNIDLVSDATPYEMKKVLKIVGEVGKKYGTCIMSEGGEIFEITTFRKDIGSVNNRKPAEVVFTDSLEEDSKRRDFTCNSIYFYVEKEEYINPNGGIEDIKNGVIKFVGKPEERLDEDILRLLRYVRIKYKFGFKDYDKNIINILKSKNELLKNLPIERIRQEFDKILLLENNVLALEELKNIGFLKSFFPEVDILETVPGNKYHLEGNVWIHTKMCILELNKYLKDISTKGFSPLYNKNDKIILYYTILLHDIAKHTTLSIDKKGDVHYYEHENIGAEIFKEKIADRLKFTNIQKKEIYWLIKNHIKLFLIPEMRPEGSALGVKKLKSRKLMINPFFEKLLIIGQVDNAGRIPVKLDKIQELKNIYSEFKNILKTKKFLTGEDIMEKYPELEGRKIGERLEMLNNEIMVRN